MSDSLFLTSVSGLDVFRPLYQTLVGMGLYSINPDDIRAWQPHESGEKLGRSGRNIASVLRRLSARDRKRINAFLAAIVPGVESVEPKSLGPVETLEFRQKIQRNEAKRRFYATSMSDGTLRSVGNLVALFQRDAQGRPPPIVGIEEPESTIHPGAAAILMDAMIEASQREQVIATTHSPELLDHRDLDVDSLRVVTNEGGETSISRCSPGTQELIKKRLFTAGELLREDQLAPEGNRFRRPAGTSSRTPAHDMLTVFPIVEGQGEVAAFPVLLRRLAATAFPDRQFECLRPYRLGRTKLFDGRELGRAVTLAESHLGGCNGDTGVIVLADSDDDCPVEMHDRLRATLGHRWDPRRMKFIAAMREFEAWFLAGASAFSGRPRFRDGLTDDPRCETHISAKARIRAMLQEGESYSPTVDQPRMVALMDIAAARKARSFEKLWRDLGALFALSCSPSAPGS